MGSPKTTILGSLSFGGQKNNCAYINMLVRISNRHIVCFDQLHAVHCILLTVVYLQYIIYKMFGSLLECQRSLKKLYTIFI